MNEMNREIQYYIETDCNKSEMKSLGYIPEQTCYVKHWGGGVFYLSCGHQTTEWPKPNYCSKCGARILDERVVE